LSDTRDEATVAGFGQEWATYDQSARDEHDLRETFDRYFRLIDLTGLAAGSVAVDLGCGSGRWARLMADHSYVVAADASPEALSVAASALRGRPAGPVLATAGALPLRGRSVDLAYSLGVLHHTTDPGAGLADLARSLKPGGKCLVYLYYDLEDRPWWYRKLWRGSDLVRTAVARLPFRLRRLVADVVAFVVYLPLSRFAALVDRIGRNADAIPLSAYRTKPIYVLRTDALDRFGTRVEHRFSRAEVVSLLEAAGLVDVRVSDEAPFWCAVGTARS
jgi:SAM-dependent methyltransferase